ncbi:hypothetical protein NG895_08450 [Aeoliella sp. ICT_H6.2]|uniref:Lipoprotein n=1 Tax=Aeoliella straminimaris TaxID=2954799 RepID=A0A9X2F7Z6_9BACT|nr:hypothetical protein [Aeoliella straminimaris]MCO6043935.1 hypothetical protein [Aeoliella straminimaris]
MSTFKNQLRGCVLASSVLAFAISIPGCGTKTTPPGADIIRQTAPGMNITFLRWKQGLTVLFVDDVEGGHNAGGTGSTENPVYTATVAAGSPETGGYKCVLETKDGKTAICRINGKGYDLSNGTLFVIKAKGEEIELHQLKRDLTTIPFDVKKCKEPIQKDAEIRELLELGELPK